MAGHRDSSACADVRASRRSGLPRRGHGLQRGSRHPRAPAEAARRARGGVGRPHRPAAARQVRRRQADDVGHGRCRRPDRHADVARARGAGRRRRRHRVALAADGRLRGGDWRRPGAVGWRAGAAAAAVVLRRRGRRGRHLPGPARARRHPVAHARHQRADGRRRRRARCCSATGSKRHRSCSCSRWRSGSRCGRWSARVRRSAR